MDQKISGSGHDGFSFVWNAAQVRDLIDSL